MHNVGSLGCVREDQEGKHLQYNLSRASYRLGTFLVIALLKDDQNEPARKPPSLRIQGVSGMGNCQVDGTSGGDSINICYGSSDIHLNSVDFRNL